MRLYSLAFVFLSVAMGSSLSWADGLIYQLPADGTWARYGIQMKATARTEGRAPQEFDLKGSLTVSIVGQVMEEGERCRWLEVKSEVSPVGHPEDIARVLLKLLIPEKHLQRGEDPLAHVLRMYYSRKGGGAMEVPMERIEDPWRKRYEIERFRSIFPRPLEDVKSFGKETVATRIGALECEKITGRSSLPKSPLREGAEWAWDGKFEFLLNNAAPFGVVGMRSERTGYETSSGENRRKTEMDTLTILTIGDVGDNATSDLVDAK